jgi:ribosomal protein S18 acetylase RimI-like enzyme
MLEQVDGLNPSQLDAVADLEQRVVAADGGRLKLEWGALRSGRNVDGFLWWDGERLLGFLGAYSFEPTSAELAGMVDPEARRQGIATALLEAAATLCGERAYEEVLLIVPRASDAGRELALKRGGVLDHSEHALVQLEAPPHGPANPRIALRTATVEDVPLLAPILEAAFGQPETHLADWLADEHAETLVIELDGSAVGTLRVHRDGTTAGVYGFAVDPAWQGRGIGRDVLRRTCRQLRGEGAERIHLEVEVDNDHALGLYTSLGFAPVTTEDYYALPRSAAT